MIGWVRRNGRREVLLSAVTPRWAPPRAALALVLVLALALAGASRANAAEPPHPPVLLLMHAGGFLLGDPLLERDAVREARSRGFETANLDYVLGNLPAAVRQVSRIARGFSAAGRRVFAYGESAGGTLAALLAERGLVERAVAVSPVPDLRGWPDLPLAFVGLKRAQAARYSPALHPAVAPLLMLVARLDAPVVIAEDRAWARQDPLVVARMVAGGHGFIGTADYPAKLKIAMDYLALHAQDPPPSPPPPPPGTAGWTP